MMQSLALEGFKSFGERQVVPLRPISALVGPNNSGKSCFISAGGFLRALAEEGVDSAIKQHGGVTNLFHRPSPGGARLAFKVEADSGSYEVAFERSEPTSVRLGFERLTSKADEEAWRRVADFDELNPHSPFKLDLADGQQVLTSEHVPVLSLIPRQPAAGDRMTAFLPVLTSFVTSRTVKLSIDSLRQDAPFTEKPALGADGSGLAAVLSLWRGAYPERAERLDAALQSTMPEMRDALVMPAPQGNAFRLWFRQKDGERFDASTVSDGVLFFTALAMHAIDAEPGGVVFIEEPEHSIHPRRLSEVMNLLRRIVEQQGCQFVIATHSPVLLRELRDEPEAILLFRRGDKGTKVTPLSEVPHLVEALDRSDPGEMLENGFFNDPLP
jgi:predicted ATPase